MLSCLGTATDLLDIPRQMTCMNPACTCRLIKSPSAYGCLGISNKYPYID